MQRYDLYVAERIYATKSTPGPLRLNLNRARADLERLKSHADVRIALAHWGRNYRKRNPRQRRLAGELVAAGADLVIGHHPHIPHPIEIANGAIVCYSLGNGPLGTPGRFHSGRPPYGLVVSVDFDQQGQARAITAQIILVDNAQVQFRPRVADDPTAQQLLRRMLPLNHQWRPCGDGGVTCDLEPTHVDLSQT